MENRARLRILPLLSLIAIVGCAARHEVRQLQVVVAELKQQVDSLRTEHAQLRSAVAHSHRLVGETAANEMLLHAELQRDLKSLAGRTSFLSERLESVERRIARHSAQLRKHAASRFVPPDSARVALPDSANVEGRRLFPGSFRLYQSSYQDLVNGEYELARQGFTQYLQLLPEGDFAEEAQYGVGETYFAQRQFDEAARVFEAFTEKYRESDRVPAAMLRLADAHLALGRTGTGRRLLEELLRRFPETSEAEQARLRLGAL